MIKPARDNADVKILEAVVAPHEPTLGASLAKAVLSLGSQRAQNEEIARLLDRSNAGTITAKQKEKLEAYVRVGNFLTLLKTKARTSLATKAGSR